MSDQPDKPEDGNPAASEPAVPEPEVLAADDVHLADPDVSADAIEPVLETAPEEVRLSEPSLGAAEISQPSAEAASLREAAAEAEAVAREAEDVGTLVAGPRPHEDLTETAAPAGTAPAGGAAGDAASGEAAETSGAEPPADGPAPKNEPAEDDAPAGPATFEATGDDPSWTGPTDEQTRWDAQFEVGNGRTATQDTPQDESQPQSGGQSGKQSQLGNEAAESGDPAGDQSAESEEASAAPEASWAQQFPVEQPQVPGSPVPPVGGPYGLPPAGPDDSAPKRIRTRGAGSTSSGRSTSGGGNRNKLVILGIVALVVIALLVFAVITIVNALRSDGSVTGSSANTTPGADGIIADSVSPLDLAAGACVRGFDADDVSADVTTVTCTTPHNAQLLATTSFPEDSEFPGEAAINASGDDLCNSVPINEDAAAGYSDLTLTQVTPTSGTWSRGDRRVDCFVVSEEGNVVSDDLLAE